jgi:hypothetical protein
MHVLVAAVSQVQLGGRQHVELLQQHRCQVLDSQARVLCAHVWPRCRVVLCAVATQDHAISAMNHCGGAAAASFGPAGLWFVRVG